MKNASDKQKIELALGRLVDWSRLEAGQIESAPTEAAAKYSEGYAEGIAYAVRGIAQAAEIKAWVDFSPMLED